MSDPKIVHIHHHYARPKEAKPKKRISKKRKKSSRKKQISVAINIIEQLLRMV